MDTISPMGTILFLLPNINIQGSHTPRFSSNLLVLFFQGSHEPGNPGKPGKVREFENGLGKPGKVREF